MKKFLLRLDDKLYKKLEELAKDQNRSINKQIEFMLKKEVK